MKEDKTVNLIECFRSFQGEGPDSGRGMYILRFKTCNRKCYWCDTSVKMRIAVEAPYLISNIQKLLTKHASGILVTGGEPTVPKHFSECVTLLNDLNYPIANVESNGYNLNNLIKAVNPTKPVKFIYSPKIFNSNDLALSKETTRELVKYYNAYIKIVFEPDNSYSNSFIDFLVDEHQDLIMNQRVWLMPKGTNLADLVKNSSLVFDACEKYNFNFSSRTHIMFGFI